jgi:hypothetical protein
MHNIDNVLIMHDIAAIMLFKAMDMSRTRMHMILVLCISSFECALICLSPSADKFVKLECTTRLLWGWHPHVEVDIIGDDSSPHRSTWTEDDR